jgi:hypothetical protein
MKFALIPAILAIRYVTLLISRFLEKILHA